MLPVLSVLSFVCLAAAGPHYNYNPPQGGSVAIHGIPTPVVAAPLAPFLAISHDAQKAVIPSLPLHTGIAPIAQPLPSHFAIRDVQVPIKPAVGTIPQSVFSIPFSSVFVPRPPYFAIRDVQVPRVPVAEEEIEEVDESDEVEDVAQALPVGQGTLPPYLGAQHDAQTPIRTITGCPLGIFGFHTDNAYGPPLINFPCIRPALTITNDIPVPVKAPAAPSLGAIRNQQIPIRGAAFVPVAEDLDISGFHTNVAYGPPLINFPSIRPALTITNDIPVPVKAPAAPSLGAIRNQQIPIRGAAFVPVAEDHQEELEDVELVGEDDRASTSQESVMQGPRYVEVAYFPIKIANIFDTREVNPDNEVHAPAGIVQSTQPIFFWTEFVNSKAHESIRSFTNSKAHPDTHKGPNEDSIATLLR